MRRACREWSCHLPGTFYIAALCTSGKRRNGAAVKVRAEREADELPFPDDSLFQYVDAQAFS